MDTIIGMFLYGFVFGAFSTIIASLLIEGVTTGVLLLIFSITFTAAASVISFIVEKK